MGQAEFSPRVLAVAALLASGGLAGCSQMATYGTGEVPEVAMLREATGSLLIRGHKKPIDYEPRAPLVMPPSDTALPPPAEAASAASDPDWPIDPSKQTAAVASTDPELGMHGNNRPRNITPEDARRLAPLGELASNAPTPVVNNDRNEVRNSMYDFINSGKKQHKAFGKALADANGYDTTRRRYLTDPPIAYAKPADSAPTEYNGVGKKRGFWQKLFPGADANTPTPGAENRVEADKTF
jgi:hypothetical protein